LQIVLGQVFSRQFGQAFIVFDEQDTYSHVHILAVAGALVHFVTVNTVFEPFFYMVVRPAMS